MPYFFNDASVNYSNTVFISSLLISEFQRGNEELRVENEECEKGEELAGHGATSVTIRASFFNF